MLKRTTNIEHSPLLNAELLDDVFKLMPDEKQALADLYQDTTDRFQIGKMIHGKILSKDGNGILISIEYKSDGLIPNYEFSDFELKRLQVNDSIEVILDRLEDESGCVILSYQKAKALKAWDKIAELAANDEPVRGVVTHKVKGGLNVDVGIPAFLPGSQVDTQRVTDFDQFVGQEVVCKILKVNKKRGNIIISRRKYLEEQRYEDKKKALDTIAEGQVLQGIVKNITSYGVFVDVGGIDGLLHITDMSWGRIAHPSELVKIGDTITVKVISFDKKHEKISLGMKQLAANPWEHVNEKYAMGSRIKGRISSITDYGLFVEVEKGVEGLVHISEISWTERINNLSRYFNVGDDVSALVVALDKDNRRMSLSIKQLSEDPWKMVAEKFKVSDRIEGKITNITDFGLFVQLLEGVDGLVHISDISWTDHVSHPSDRYKKGDIVKAVVMAIDTANRKVSLGIKQLDKDPWADVASEYKLGSVIEGTVSKITNFGAFIKLPTGIEGLVHISELSDKEVEKVEDILQVGQAASFRIIKVSPDERKLGLSLKPQKEKETRESSAHVQEKPAAAPQQQQHEATPEQHHRQTERREESKRDRERDDQRRDRERDRERDDQKRTAKPKEQQMIKSSLQQALEDHAAKQQKQAESDDNNQE